MQVLVNNKACELPAEATIAMMLDASGIAAVQGIALAVNSDVVSRDNWETHELKDNDKIMIIRATQGG